MVKEEDFPRGIRKALLEVAFELKVGGREEGSMVKTVGTSNPGSRKSQCRDPEAGASSMFQRELLGKEGTEQGKWNPRPMSGVVV